MTNVALGKTVTMSSLFTSTQHGDGVWAYAVDGNTNQDWYVGGCAGTISETNPWLAIDLGDIYTVTSLKIYDRVDYDCKYVMSRVVKKNTYLLYFRKQRRRSAADQRLCFRHIDCIIPPLPKPEISSPVCVGPSRILQRQGFS